MTKELPSVIQTSSPDIIQQPLLEGLPRYQKVKLACEFILNKKNKRSSKKTLSSNMLFEEAGNAFGHHITEIPKNTFYQYLSNTIKDTESQINCLGRRQGYYLLDAIIEGQPEETSTDSASIAESAQALSTEADSSTAERKQKECLLYPVLESWLVAQGYQAADISNGRSLGKWGNPDVAGISALETISGISVEVATIEAKVSLDTWEKWIFEAVSHRRFANRSYFAFAHSAETVSKIPQDMRYYAELFNIGVLVISVDDNTFKELLNGDLTESLESDKVDIVEIYSAPYNFVQAKYQHKFCTALGIQNMKQFYQWGTPPE